MQLRFSRREALQKGALGAAASVFLAREALAQTGGAVSSSPPPPFFPGVYRFQIGATNAVVISDGTSRFPNPHPLWAPQATPKQFANVLSEYFLPANELLLHFNVLAIESAPGKWALVDTGSGNTGGPTLGKLLLGLQHAGISRESVHDVLVSHAHSDHIAGAFGEDKSPVFPNATFHVHALEEQFWTKSPDLSKIALPPEFLASLLGISQNFFELARPRMALFSGGKPLFNGLVTPIFLPGHTPGHCGFLIGSGEDKLFHFADLAHHHVLMFSRPEWTVGFDTDQKVSSATRRQQFRSFAGERTRTLGYHLPFPGLGRLRTWKNGYQWVSEPMNLSS